MTLQEMIDHSVVGNFVSDAALWSALEEFISDDTNSMEDRKTALRKVDSILGEEVEVGEKDVLEYCEMLPHA
jgi:hypothetical protein